MPTLEQLAQQELVGLKARIGKLEAFLGTQPNGVVRKRRRMSAAARAKISAAQKKRWAKQKKGN